jgi:hypothetical protein
MIKMQSDTHINELDAAADDLSVEEDESDKLRW